MGMHAPKRRTLLIPVELCEYVMREKYFAPFSLFLTLKFFFDDSFVLTNEQLDLVREFLGYDTIRSVKNNLRALLKCGFLGFNPKTKRWHLRGLGFLWRKFQFQSLTGVFGEAKDILNIRGFCVATVATSIIKSRIRKRWLLGSKKRCPSQRSHPSFLRISNSGDFLFADDMIADSYLAKKLDVSNFAVNKWKKLAATAGYIKIINNLKPLGLSSKHRKAWLRAYPETEPFLRTSNGRLYVQLPDSVISHMRFAQRKKKSQRISDKGFGKDRHKR